MGILKNVKNRLLSPLPQDSTNPLIEIDVMIAQTILLPEESSNEVNRWTCHLKEWSHTILLIYPQLEKSILAVLIIHLLAEENKWLTHQKCYPIERSKIHLVIYLHLEKYGMIVQIFPLCEGGDSQYPQTYPLQDTSYQVSYPHMEEEQIFIIIIYHLTTKD